MAMVFDYALTEGIAQISYIIGDDTTGTAAVIDPRPPCGTYLRWARNFGVAITHIIETHNHADFLSGARQLSHRCGAPVYLMPEPGQVYEFGYDPLADGETLTFGQTVLTVRHTPGHTRAHIALEAAEIDKRDTPWGVFTGDSLFVNSAGRPDLSHEKEELAKLLYDTLYRYYLSLGDGVIIYPGHGKGSACGANIGDRLQSTIGYERQHNPFLLCTSKSEFISFVNEGMPPEPSHYARLKKRNAAGPPTFNRPAIPSLSPERFHDVAVNNNNLVIDTRSTLAFGGGHIPGVINIPAQSELSVYAGWMLDADVPLLLILEDDTQLDDVLDLFYRTGFARFAGYLAGGMTAWDNAGKEIETMTPLSIHDIWKNGLDVQILDVRSESEWTQGHIPGATHFFIGEMRENLPPLDKKRPVATYCGSGYRAGIAASILKVNGFEQVHNVPGSWNAWRNAGYPIEQEAGKT